MTDPVDGIVTGIVAAQAGIAPEAVHLTSSPQELGLDSLALVEMVFAIEEAFDIAVPFNASASGAQSFDISTIGSIVAAVRALVAAKPQDGP